MADQKNDPKAANAAQDDKSINDLLKEYAEDVKDKDLDDFLKGTDEDSFDTDSSDDDGDNDDTSADSIDQPKKSGGFFTALMLVVAFGAAGAGAYVYLNRNEGMTSIMGGFMGNDASQTVASTIAPETQPVMPAPANDTGAPAQPAPISNEVIPATSGAGSAYSTMEDPTTGNQPVLADQPATPDTAAPTAPAAEASLSVPEATPAQTVPTPVAATPNTAEQSPAIVQASEAASKAVDAWAASVGNNTATTDDAANTGQKLPEQAVSEVKAKAPTTAKKEKSKAAKPVEVPTETSTFDSSDSKPASAPKAKAPLSPLDEALPPPYMAIQARKASGSTPDVTMPAQTTSAPKMQPVIEGGASASVSANDNVADISKTTGDLATMVGQGGGKIEIVNHASAPAALAPQAPMTAPLAQAPRAVAQQPSAPVPTPNTAIGIGGSGSGRSVPPSDDNGAAPAKASATQIPAASLPESMDSAPQEQGLQAPVAAPVGGQDAKAILAQAMSLESAGKASEALSLYQRALEADAVYADGKSIDRGMVYDRIGALRAAGAK